MSGKPWSAQEIRTLRRLYPVLGAFDTAAALGRSACAVKARALLLRIRVDGWNVPWTRPEREFVRANYKHLPCREIAARLGRTVSGVLGQASKMGLFTKRQPIDREARMESLRRLHALGWSDAEIAAEWGFTRKVAEDWRKRAGLPANGWSQHQRDRVRAKTAEQLRKAGLPSIGHLRVEAFKKFARDNGWPEDLRPRAVMMLNAMWQRGPMTRRELADAIGMPWKGTRNSLHSNDPEGTYLAALMKRGLVVCLKRAGTVTGQGRGRSVNLYTLALDVQRRKVV